MVHVEVKGTMEANEQDSRMRMRTKLLLGFLSIVTLMTAAVGITIWQQSIIQECFALLERTDNVERFLLECRRQEKNFLLRMDQSSLGLFQANFDSLLHSTVDLRKDTVNPEIAAKLPLLTDRIIEYGEVFEDVRSAWPTGIGDEAQASLEGKMVIHARGCHEIVSQIRGISISTFYDAQRVTQNVSVVSIALGLLLSIVIAGILTRHIAGPLDYLRNLAERVSTGDIQDMDVEFTELETKRFNTRESFALARSLQRMVTSIRLLVSSERGLMDDYHMTIVVLVNKAVGPGGWSLIESARSAAGFGSFADVNPSNVETFLIELGKRAIMIIPKERVDLLADAVRTLRQG